MRTSEEPEMTKAAKRPKQPFDPALGAPVVLSPDQLEEVAAGAHGLAASSSGGTTTGAVPPPEKVAW